MKLLLCKKICQWVYYVYCTYMECIEDQGGWINGWMAIGDNTFIVFSDIGVL